MFLFNSQLETKLQFARDDPAFLVLLSGLLCGKYYIYIFLIKLLLLTFIVFTVSSIAFTYVLRLGFIEFLKFLLYIVTIDCLLSGVAISSLIW